MLRGVNEGVGLGLGWGGLRRLGWGEGLGLGRSMIRVLDRGVGLGLGWVVVCGLSLALLGQAQWNHVHLAHPTELGSCLLLRVEGGLGL